MPRQTLREYLSTPNPRLFVPPRATVSSTVTKMEWPPIDRTRSWKDLKDINILFADILDKEFELAALPPLPPMQHNIRDERGFEFVLTRWNNIIVNEALRAACAHWSIDRITWTVGSSGNSYHDGIIRPDWAGVTNTTNVVSGDTKFSPEDPSRVEIVAKDAATEQAPKNQLDSDGQQLSSPLSAKKKLYLSWIEQVNYYALSYSTRYCYVISNWGLLAVRLTKEPPLPQSASIAISRERRNNDRVDTSPTPIRGKSTTLLTAHIPSSPPMPFSPGNKSTYPMTPSPLRGALLAEKLQSSAGRTNTTDYTETTGYTDDGYLESDMADVEVRRIPWEGENLNVNFVLFAIHLLAYRSNAIENSYPSLVDDPAHQIFLSKT